jgi:hypothetical protein
MKNENIANKIYNIMAEQSKNTIFTNNDFYYLANKEAIRKAIFRLKRTCS